MKNYLQGLFLFFRNRYVTPYEENVDIIILPNNYNFAKMAVKLGTAPVIIDSKTYVPTNFIEEILKAEVEAIEDGLKIIY